MGASTSAQSCLLAEGWCNSRAIFPVPHHPRLGFHCSLPYSAGRGKKSVNRQALDELKRQIPLMSYLETQQWRPLRSLARGRWMGLCPLHQDHKPSFLVDPHRHLFYCYGCGRGGDVIRFAELFHQVKFPQALSLLREWRGVGPLLDDAARFYQAQLQHHDAALAYLHQRGARSRELIERMRIGYAPGGCLRAVLSELGHSLSALRQAGLVNAAGRDTFVDRIVFPLDGNIYARSLAPAPEPHRFLPGSKGGLYGWTQVRSCSELILVEGLFDYVVLWEADFRNVTCSLGTHLNARQIEQICDAPRIVYLVFDADPNGSGQHAAHRLSQSLRLRGVLARLVALPEGHDPNTFFTQGGDAAQFRALLESAAS